jgi:hypothetical protein
MRQALPALAVVALAAIAAGAYTISASADDQALELWAVGTADGASDGGFALPPRDNLHVGQWVQLLPGPNWIFYAIPEGAQLASGVAVQLRLPDDPDPSKPGNRKGQK